MIALALCAALLPLDRVEGDLRAARERLALVEKEVGGAEDPGELLRLRDAFAQGETQYLLGDYASASALLWDVADDEKAPDHLQALKYLADSLYRLQNWPEARRYYARLLPDPDAMVRLFELSLRTGQHEGLDEAWPKLKSPRPEAVYQHARWLALRGEIGRALEAFHAIGDADPFAAQARYFEGALLVQRGSLEESLRAFERALRLGAPDSKVRPPALLAMGRVLFEQGKYAPAIERYREASSAEAVPEEMACWLRLGEIGRALELAEKMEPLPETRLLRANLLLKLKRYPDAERDFTALAAELRPVEAQIHALTARADPVAFYDQLFAGASADESQLLPEIARASATGAEVARARETLSDLADVQREAKESDAILARLDASLQKGGLELFPALQEGNARAKEIDETLQRLEGETAQLQADAAILDPSAQTGARISAAQAAMRDARSRLQAVREALKQKGARKLQALRSRVEGERAQLLAMEKSLSALAGDSRQLLGRVAMQSFARVEGKFHDLALKSEVGLIDSAWSRRKDRADGITALESEKRAELKELEEAGK